MKNRIKAELIILLHNKMFLATVNIALIMFLYNMYIAYNIYTIQITGGYFIYNALMIQVIVCLFLPITTGALLGGEEYYGNTISFKISNMTIKEMVSAKFSVLFLITATYSIILTLMGMIMDIVSYNSFCIFNINTMIFALKRMILIICIEILWGIISFCIALITKSIALSVVVSILVFYLEQYLGLYVQEAIMKFLFVWNQKSLLVTLFNDEVAPFGVVQSNYNSCKMSMVVLLMYVVIIAVGAKLILKKREY